MLRRKSHWLQQHVKRLTGRIIHHRRQLVRWWGRGDLRYGWPWRITSFALVGLIVGGLLAPIALHLQNDARYRLSPDAAKVVGVPDARLVSQLTYDSKAAAYHFNASAVTNGANPNGPQRAQVGASSRAGSSTYALDVPQDYSQGLTYHDINTQLSFKLVPQFSASDGKSLGGHLIYPLTSGTDAVYTLKDNGLKEDLVVDHAPANGNMSFSYQLELPGTLQAKMIPGTGNVGIYSADPTLFGNVSYGSAADQVAVAAARANGAKTYLLFALPAPTITTAPGVAPGHSEAHFDLSGNTLTVVATGLNQITGTFSIDPSVVFTSSSDFQTNGTNESNIDFSTSGQVTRGAITGGTVSGGWSSANTGTSFTTARSDFATVVNSGYLYVMGGFQGSNSFLIDVKYAPINSNGTIGTWGSTSNFLTAGRFDFAATVYDGYMYIMGGVVGNAGAASDFASDVQYSAIATNGTLGTWHNTTSLPSARGELGAAAYNGYLYMIGGNNAYDGGPGNRGGNYLNDNAYAPINADGTIGSWTTTTSFTTARDAMETTMYNGYLYIAGGNISNGGASLVSDVQYAKMNADGSLSAWTTTTSFTTGRIYFGFAPAGGYMYVSGGQISGSFLSDTQYAPINANGSLGVWAASVGIPAVRGGQGMVAVGGYLYSIGGQDTGSHFNNDIQYAKFDSAGVTGPQTATSSFVNGRFVSGSIAYNGYLYLIGGSNGSTFYSDVQYASINANGTLGTWNYTHNSTNDGSTYVSGLLSPEESFGLVIANGYMYVVGGYNSTIGSTAAVEFAAVNGNGTIGTWNYTHNSTNDGSTFVAGFTTARNSPGVVAYDGYLYLAGGGDCSQQQPCKDVQYAALNANGTVGSWTASANQMPDFIMYGVAMVSNGYMYVVGGKDDDEGPATVLSEVYYAHITVGGDVGTWASTTSLPAGRENMGGIIRNGYMYIIGGDSGGVFSFTPQSTDYYAPINANGTVGTWNTTSALTSARYGSVSAQYGDHVYTMGGYNNSSYLNDTQFATFNNGGSGLNSSWTGSSNYMADTRNAFGSVVYNGYIYVVGGTHVGTDQNTVQYAPISANGDVGAFSQDGHTFTSVRHLLGLAVYNGYLYVVGGQDYAGTTFYKDVQFAPIGASGGLTAAFTSAGNNFDSVGRSGTCTFTYKGNLYVGGGFDGTSYHADFRYAPLGSGGSVGTWADSGNNFTTARADMGCFAANGYVYILGGRGASSATYNDVQSATINSNGTLGTWQYTTSFPTARFDPMVAVANGYAYIYGGCTSGAVCSGELSDVQMAPLGANGAIGNWTQNSVSLSSAHGQGAGGAYNGYIYSVGGCVNASCTAADYQLSFAPVSAPTRNARYSKLVDLGASLNVSGISYNGTVPGDGTAITYRAAGSGGVFNNSGTANAISATSGCVGNVSNARYLLVTTALGDDTTGSGIFPDSLSNRANVTDFTVTYQTVHPAAVIRLNLGKTLQSGNLSALDTCSG